jgi:hypothetical protein
MPYDVDDRRMPTDLKFKEHQRVRTLTPEKALGTVHDVLPGFMGRLDRKDVTYTVFVDAEFCKPEEDGHRDNGCRHLKEDQLEALPKEVNDAYWREKAEKAKQEFQDALEGWGNANRDRAEALLSLGDAATCYGRDLRVYEGFTRDPEMEAKLEEALRYCPGVGHRGKYLGNSTYECPHCGCLCTKATIEFHKEAKRGKG